jgi:tricorn protease
MRAPAIICLMILGLAPLHAQQRLQLMSHPAVSPDGKRLAFDYNGDIWVASSDGGVARPISNHPARDSHPVFSPDGQSIA